MSDKQKIDQLEKEISELKGKVDLLKDMVAARPATTYPVLPYYPYPVTIPYWTSPPSWTYPSWTYTNTCGNSSTNTVTTGLATGTSSSTYYIQGGTTI
jgi:hypothetical protein